MIVIKTKKSIHNYFGVINICLPPDSQFLWITASYHKPNGTWDVTVYDAFWIDDIIAIWGEDNGSSI